MNTKEKTQIPVHILRQLYYRFLITNVPTRDPDSVVKYCVYIEKAYWVYVDDYSKMNTSLPKRNFHEFAKELFEQVHFLQIHLPKFQTIMEQFKSYTDSLPTYGAILLSKDLQHVLLLRTECALGLWGFPKGKIDDKEDRVQCAIREVHEETGYHISPFIKDNLYIQGTWNNRFGNGFTGLYIIPNVPMETLFKSKTQREVVEFEWFKLNDFLEAKNGLNADTAIKLTANAFYMKEYFRLFLRENPTLTSNHFNESKFDAGGGFDANHYQQQQIRNERQNHHQQQQQSHYQQNRYQKQHQHYQQKNRYEQRSHYQQRNDYQQRYQQNRYAILTRSIVK